MAAPVVASVGTTGTWTSGGARAVPMPSGITAGDLLLVWVSSYLNGSVSVSAGWTSIFTAVPGSSPDPYVARLTLYAKIAAGSDTCTVTSADEMVVKAVRVVDHGVSDVSTDIATATATTNPTRARSTDQPDPPALTPGSTADWLYFAAAAAGQYDWVSPGGITAVPSGYTEVVAAQSRTSMGLQWCSLGVGYKSTTGSSSDNPGLFTNVIDYLDDTAWAANTLAIPPAGGGDPPGEGTFTAYDHTHVTAEGDSASWPFEPPGDALFDDDFATLDLDDWNVVHLSHERNNEIQRYHQDQVTATGSQLVLTCEPTEDIPGWTHKSGAVWSVPTFTAPVRIAFRARMDVQMGGWPALWVTPMEVRWPPEIDVMEAVDQEGGYWVNWHYGNEANSTEGTVGATFVDDIDLTEWHTFWCDWETDVIRFYIDETLVRTVTTNVTQHANHAQSLAMNLALGGDWPEGPDGTTTYPIRMWIDRVAVWEIDEEQGPPDAKMSELTDAFTSLDTGKWSASVGVTATGGVLTIPVSDSYTDQVTSLDDWDFVESYAFCEVVGVPNLGNETTEGYFRVLASEADQLQIVWSGGLLYTNVVTSSSEDWDSGVAFDPVDHRWWRLIDEGGTVQFQVSADGETWSTLRSVTRPVWAATPVSVGWRTGFYGTEPSPGTFQVANFNVVAAEGSFTAYDHTHAAATGDAPEIPASEGTFTVVDETTVSATGARTSDGTATAEATDTVGVDVDAPGPPVVVSLTSGANTTDASSFSTASITPSVDALVLAFIYVIGADTPPEPTCSGNGLTWAKVETALDHQGLRRLTVFRAQGTPTTGSVTFDFDGDSQASAVWTVVQAVNAAVGDGGDAAIVQTVAAAPGSNSANGLTVNLAAVQAADTIKVAGFGIPRNDNGVPGPGAGMTQVGYARIGSPNTSMIAVTEVPSSTSDVEMSATWASLTLPAVAVALELSAVSTAPAGQFAVYDHSHASVTGARESTGTVPLVVEDTVAVAGGRASDGTAVVVDTSTVTAAGARDSAGAAAAVAVDTVEATGARASTGEASAVDETHVSWSSSTVPEGRFTVVDTATVAAAGTRESEGTVTAADTVTVVWTGAAPSVDGASGQFTAYDHTTVAAAGARDSAGAATARATDTVSTTGARDSEGTATAHDNTHVQWAGQADELAIPTGQFVMYDHVHVDPAGERASTGTATVHDHCYLAATGARQSRGMCTAHDTTHVRWTGPFPNGRLAERTRATRPDHTTTGNRPRAVTAGARRST